MKPRHPSTTYGTDIFTCRELGSLNQPQVRRSIYDSRLDSLRILRKHPLKKMNAAVSCMDIDRLENSFLLCGGVSGAIYLSNLLVYDQFAHDKGETFTLPSSFGHQHFVSSCQWYHDIRLFISASSSGELAAWDVSSISVLESFRVCQSGIWRPQLHWNEIDRTNPLIAVTNGSNNVPLYDLRIGGLAQEVRCTIGKPIKSVRWLPSKHHVLFCGDNNGTLSVWDIRSNRRALISYILRNGSSIRGIRLTSDGCHLVAVFYSGVVILYDAVTMDEIAVYELRRAREWTEKMSNALDHFAIADEGTSIRVALPVEDDVEWIRFSKGYHQEQKISLVSTFSAHLSRVNACVYRNGSQQLYTAGADRNVLCWAPECERKRLHLEAESSTDKGPLSDDWSDDD